jgi:mannose-6-phosphate isomerase-like protein (cupin superfamily)
MPCVVRLHHILKPMSDRIRSKLQPSEERAKHPASASFATGEGRTYALGKARVTFKPQQGGDFSICESIMPGHSSAGLHRHDDDERHVVLAGRHEGQVGDEVRTLEVGDMMFAPRATVHGLRNLDASPARQMGISSPDGRFEAFVADVAAAQVDSGGPSHPGAPAFREIAERHAIEFIASIRVP